MIIRERVPLAQLTTLRVGGAARYVIACETREDVSAALAFARERALPWRVLGGGSNVLADDAGYEGVILEMRLPGIEAVAREGRMLVTAGAGVPWDDLVRFAADAGLWGLENLAGIPGTVGAAPVQNIGAYGAETKDTLHSVEALDARSLGVRTIPNEECGFGYRESRFKHDRSLVILSVTFALSKDGAPALAYKDLEAARVQGADLSAPAAIADAVRAIRARKFPDTRTHGTAGSFFKNPTVSEEAYASLTVRHPDLPGFPNAGGVKIPLAFVLDRMLGLRGYREGSVSLFTEQPLVLVASEGANASMIDAFADGIATRVYDETGVAIEREVQSFPDAHET